jgi:hypothetical protein
VTRAATKDLLKFEHFSEDQNKLRFFLEQLRVNYVTLSNQQTRLRYVFVLLHEVALNQILSYVKNDRINFVNLAELIDVLKAIFENLNQ